MGGLANHPKLSGLQHLGRMCLPQMIAFGSIETPRCMLLAGYKCDRSFFLVSRSCPTIPFDAGFGCASQGFIRSGILYRCFVHLEVVVGLLLVFVSELTILGGKTNYYNITLVYRLYWKTNW